MRVSLNAFALLATLLAGSGVEAGGQAQVNEHGAAVKAFRDRADAYLAQHREAAKGLPALKDTDDVAALAAREDELGKRIAAARATSKPGDLIGSDLEPYIRAAVKKEWASRPADDRSTVGEDKPSAGVARINSAYPREQPLATFPASLLAELPPLPEGLEYRFAGRHLIVRDVKANLVVDVLANVIPQTPASTGAPSAR